MRYQVSSSVPAAKPAPAFFVLDTETTGLDPATASVVEVGIVLFREGKPVETFGRLIRPRNGFDSPDCEEALRVNGLTRADLQAAPTFREVHVDLARWLAALDVNEPAVSLPVYAFNLPFDRKHMAAEYAAIGLSDCIPWAGCIAVQAAKKLGPRKAGESRRLTALAQRFGIDTGTAHRAVDDARTAGLLCLALGA